MWQCDKMYPKIALKGSAMMFLWFCPMHGHCYGYHIVNGSEGRKDPCHSLYTHLEKAPEIVYYDFACQLEEFSLNREAGFFCDTRFFHDVFHGFAHKCPCCYSSRSVVGLDCFNSSICLRTEIFLCYSSF